MTGIIVGLSDAGDGLQEVTVRYDYGQTVRIAKLFEPNTVTLSLWDRVRLTLEQV